MYLMQHLVFGYYQEKKSYEFDREITLSNLLIFTFDEQFMRSDVVPFLNTVRY